MKITLSPQRSDAAPLEVAKEGDVLIINGVRVDLASLSEPSEEGDAEYPEWIVTGNAEAVTLLLPYGPLPEGYGPDDPEIRAVTFPEPIRVTEDGPVSLPVLPEPVEDEVETDE